MGMTDEEKEHRANVTFEIYQRIEALEAKYNLLYRLYQALPPVIYKDLEQRFNAQALFKQNQIKLTEFDENDTANLIKGVRHH